MPAERVAMRKVRETLRLKLGVGLSKAIARSLGIALSTVRSTLERVDAAGLSWPLPDDATDTILDEKLYGRTGTKQGHRRRAEPDWTVVHRELKKKHATLAILREEYIAQNPDGYRYSRYGQIYVVAAGVSQGFRQPPRLASQHKSAIFRPTGSSGMPSTTGERVAEAAASGC